MSFYNLKLRLKKYRWHPRGAGIDDENENNGR